MLYLRLKSNVRTLKTDVMLWSLMMKSKLISSIVHSSRQIAKIQDAQLEELSFKLKNIKRNANLSLSNVRNVFLNFKRIKKKSIIVSKHYLRDWLKWNLVLRIWRSEKRKKIFSKSLQEELSDSFSLQSTKLLSINFKTLSKLISSKHLLEDRTELSKLTEFY